MRILGEASVNEFLLVSSTDAGLDISASWILFSFSSVVLETDAFFELRNLRFFFLILPPLRSSSQSGPLFSSSRHLNRLTI